MSVKQVNTSLNAYIKRRDKLSQAEWRKLRGFLNNAKNDIVQKLKGFGVTEWQTSNLNAVMDSINNTIERFDMQYKAGITDAQKRIMDEAANSTNIMARAGNLTPSNQVFLSDEAILAIKPLSNAMAQNFIDDMSKILSTEITLGVVNQESTVSVANNIVEKFGTDSRQKLVLENDLARLTKRFKSGEISKEAYVKKSAALNRKLKSGSMMSFGRAERIANTEMLRSASLAENQRTKEIRSINPDAVKFWVHSGKADAREGHIEAERTYKANPIPTEQPFLVRPNFTKPFEEGQFPRDPSFSPGNSVWCGCSMVVVSKDLVGELGGVEVQQ